MLAPGSRWIVAEGRNSARAPSTPASGCGNRVPIAIPAAPAAITSSSPPASTAMLGAPMAPRSCTTAAAAPSSSRLAGTAPARPARWARVRVLAVAGKLAYRSAMASRRARPAASCAATRTVMARTSCPHADPPGGVPPQRLPPGQIRTQIDRHASQQPGQHQHAAGQQRAPRPWPGSAPSAAGAPGTAR